MPGVIDQNKIYLSSSIFSVLCCLVYGNQFFGPVCSDSFSRGGWKLEKPFPQGSGKPVHNRVKKI